MSVSECTFVARDIVLSDVNIRYKIATFNAHPRSCIYIISRGNSSHHAYLDVDVYSLMKEQIRHSQFLFGNVFEFGLPPQEQHLIVVGWFECLNEPESYAGWSNLIVLLEGSPMLDWLTARGQTKIAPIDKLRVRPVNDKKKQQT